MNEEKPECDGCGFTDYEGVLLTIYEDEYGPDSGVGLCWECRHPNWQRHCAMEAAYAERALQIVGIDPKEEEAK